MIMPELYDGLSRFMKNLSEDKVEQLCRRVGLIPVPYSKHDSPAERIGRVLGAIERQGACLALLGWLAENDSKAFRQAHVLCAGLREIALCELRRGWDVLSRPPSERTEDHETIWQEATEALDSLRKAGVAPGFWTNTFVGALRKASQHAEAIGQWREYLRVLERFFPFLAHDREFAVLVEQARRTAADASAAGVDGVKSPIDMPGNKHELTSLRESVRAALRDGRREDAEAALARLTAAPGGRSAFAEQARALLREARWLRAGLLRDPVLQQARPDAYEVLARAGVVVHPGVSLDVLRDMSGAIQRLGPEEQRAHAELCDLEARLLIDAQYYRVQDGGVLLAVLADGLGAPSDTARAAGPNDAAALHLLRGEREQALAWWRVRHSEQPRDAALAWSLCLCHAAAALAAERDGDLEGATAAWRAAIPYFAVALSDLGHWRVWSSARARVYGRTLATDGAVKHLTARFLTELAQFCARAQCVDELSSVATLELRAVSLVRKAGGLTTPHGGKLWAGPLALATSGLGELAGALCAELARGHRNHVLALADEPDVAEFARKLRLLFSGLRFAAAHLELELLNPAAALRELQRDRCSACPSVCRSVACPRHALSPRSSGVCCVECPRFLTENPAYAAVAGAQALYRADVAWLSAQALFHLGKQHLEPYPGELSGEVAGLWQQALALAAECGTARALSERMVRSVELLPPREHPRLRLALFEALHAAGVDRAPTLRLVEELRVRGIRFIMQRDHETALTTLERAYGLVDPATDPVRDCYATAFVLAAEVAARSDHELAWERLQRAQALVTDGLRSNPAFAEYHDTQKLIDELRPRIDPDMLSRSLASALAAIPEGPKCRRQARTLHDSGNHSGALVLYEEIAAAAHGNASLLDEILETLSRAIARASAEDRPVEAARLLSRWCELLGNAPNFAPRWRVHRSIQHVRAALDEAGFKFREGRGVFTVPFEADVFGTLTVEIHVDDEGVGLASLLTLGANEVRRLGHILQATGEIAHFCVSPRDGDNYALSSRVVPLGEPGGDPSQLGRRLRMLLWGHREIADVSSVTLDEWPRLRQHVELARQKLCTIMSVCSSDELALFAAALERRGEWAPRSIEQGQLRYERRADGRAPITLSADGLGLRLTQPLGRLRSGDDHLELLRAVCRANERLTAGKVALDHDGVVRLSAETLALDEAGLAAAEEFLRAHAEELSRTLVNSDEGGDE